MSVRGWRVVFAVAAVAAGAYAALLMWEVAGSAPWSVLRWLAGGVLLHDAVLAPAVLLLGLLTRWFVPRPWHAPAAVALVTWGALTLLAVPVLGRFGARADNPTLLDRSYLLSWLVMTALVVATMSGAGWWRSTRRDR